MELLRAKPISGNPNGNYTLAKNPRILHLEVQRDTNSIFYECLAAERFFVERGVLEAIHPDSSLTLSEHACRISTRWLANRYWRAVRKR